MSGFLRQSTSSQSRALGPFVDDTDFKSAETGLTIANTDVKLIVNGGASANKNSGGGTHRANGVYGFTFDATDTATVGEIEVSIVVAGALPVFDKFVVLEEAVYDALFAASAPGFATVAALATVDGKVDTVDTVVDAIKAKTDNLPTDPADESLVIAATDAIMSRIGAPVGASISADVAAVQADTDDIQSRLPAALTAGGNLKADAQVVSDKTGYALTAAYDAAKTAAQAGDAMTLTSGERTTLAAAIWGALTSALTTVGSIGKLLVDRIDAAITSRLADADYVAPLDAAGVRSAVGLASANLDTQLDGLPTAAENSDAVWDEPLAGHATAGSAGAGLTAAGSAGDPWATELPGVYGAGTAGKIVGDNLDVAVSSRSSHSAADVWAVGARTLTSFGTLVSDIWSAVTRTLTAGTNIVLAKGVGVTGFNDLDASGVRAAVGLAAANLDTQLAAITPPDVPTAAENATAVRTELATELARIDVASSTLLADADYTAPDNAGIAAIKVKTDNLPSDPADESLIIAATDALGALSTAIKAKTDNLPVDPASASGIPSSNDISTAVWAYVTEGTMTALQAMRGFAAVLFGKASGMATTTATFRDVGDTKDRVTATVDADGNRTSVTKDLT